MHQACQPICQANRRGRHAGDALEKAGTDACARSGHAAMWCATHPPHRWRAPCPAPWPAPHQRNWSSKFRPNRTMLTSMQA